MLVAAHDVLQIFSEEISCVDLLKSGLDVRRGRKLIILLASVLLLKVQSHGHMLGDRNGDGQTTGTLLGLKGVALSDPLLCCFPAVDHRCLLTTTLSADIDVEGMLVGVTSKVSVEDVTDLRPVIPDDREEAHRNVSTFAKLPLDLLIDFAVVQQVQKVTVHLCQH